MSRNRIETGGSVYTDGYFAQIRGGSCVLAGSISGSELSIDTMSAELDVSADVPTVFAPSDAPAMLGSDDALFTVLPWVRIRTADPSAYVYGQEVRYYHDGKLVGLFYMESIKRVGVSLYEITCFSAMGLLDKRLHYGGLYTGQTMETVLADIMGGVVSYSLDPALKTVKIYGWLPIATRRENLHQLLFAFGVSAEKDEEGELYFTRLDNSAPVYIPDDRMFLGGGVDFGTPAARISVTEHTYAAYAEDEEKTLFEGDASVESILTPGGAAVSGTLVKFDEPMHDLAVTGSTILERGPNYAVLSGGVGVLLTGKVYTHTMRVISREKPAALSLVDQKDNEVSVSGCTLVSLTNSDAVADRMMAYYGYAQTVTNDLVVGEERPGDAVTFTNPFEEQVTGFVQSLEITMSNVLRAAATLISGYVPPFSPVYEHRAVLTGSGAWPIPAGTGRVRYVLIGGAQGGYAGKRGGDGSIKNISYSYQINYGSEVGGVSISVKGYHPGPGGKGGEGGLPGAGGKILIGTMDVSGLSSLAYQCGVGGAGAVWSAENPDVPGAAGGDTILGGVSSAQGVSSPMGYMDIITGEVYAASGKAGIRGGNGAGCDLSSINNSTVGTFTPAEGAVDEDGNAYPGGTVRVRSDGRMYEEGSEAQFGPKPENGMGIAVSSVGLGSGAAAGQAGSNGIRYPETQSATRYGSTSISLYAATRSGLNGANASLTPRKAANGNGGTGGYGGGGGSSCGVGYTGVGGSPTGTISQTLSPPDHVGTGGSPSPGGQGADGLIILYY